MIDYTTTPTLKSPYVLDDSIDDSFAEQRNRATEQRIAYIVRSIPQTSYSKFRRWIGSVDSHSQPMPVRKVDFKQAWSENSTVSLVPPEELEELVEEFESLFDIAGQDFLEDTTEAELSRELLVMMEQYGEIVIEILANLIIGEKSVGNRSETLS
jgi:hypothetical protein